jgi:hypothetical protein
MRRRRAIFLMLAGLKRCPPKPGSTLITSTEETCSSTSSSNISGVAGLIATDASAPSSRMRDRVRVS